MDTGKLFARKPPHNHTFILCRTLVRPKNPWRDGSTLPKATTREHYTCDEPPTVELPAADLMENQVLRFFCFFKSHVEEDKMQNIRVRRCNLYYYLEDDTVQIEEPQIDNSGLRHGTLIKRHRIQNASNPMVYISPADLCIGREITIYGITIRMADCDEFTRKWYKKSGNEQPPPEEIPRDSFVTMRRLSELQTCKVPMTYDKQYREVMLGGGFVNQNMQQFMEKDRMVCRFFASYDDSLSSRFERRLMVILFYLCDDTIEIREHLPTNSSRPHFPVYFRRRKLPKTKVAPLGPCDPLLKKEDYFQITDFKVGSMMRMLDVDFFVYDADGFTREYFRRELKIELDPAIDVRIDLPPPPDPPVPPPTGYGTDSDSMTSVKYIVPKQRIEQYKKSNELDGKCLRFRAHLLEPLAPGQKKRLFCIEYHLADEEVAITEIHQRDVGVTGGKFLQKGKYKHEQTQQTLRPCDFSVGKKMCINKHFFQVVDADQFTRTYMTTGKIDSSQSDLHRILQRLRDSLDERLTTLRDMFRKLDQWSLNYQTVPFRVNVAAPSFDSTNHFYGATQDKNGVVTVEELKSCLAKVGYELSPEEVLTLLRYFDTNGDHQVNYVEFCDSCLKSSCNTSGCCPLSVKSPRGAADPAAHCVKRLEEASEIKKAVRKIQHLFYQQPRLLNKLAKEFSHMTVGKTVTASQVCEALKSIGHEFPLSTVQRCIAYMFPEKEFEDIDYNQFIQTVCTSYNDFPSER
ncbi:putative EFHC1 [Toxoplasma gondii TgCatPRC2]|uniref:Putative EFHC1 n=1 Tax=Toxoplasma gondii TgCatPRC2 TaxID=1130821 RepID=A0A151H286_TOXGO|nr:putative EFHC1 [Toxoplasma gondii TgCatPRC2]